jgi:transcriptional regulator with XRE-family HTH domain
MRRQFERGPKKARALDAHVADRLRMRRLTVGLSQEDLGKASGVAMQQIQKYESGQNRIPATRLFEFAVLLGVTVDWFFEGLDRKVGTERERRPQPSCQGHANDRLELDVVRLLRSYRSIRDADGRSAVRHMANSLAKRPAK